ncbi:hypothetical protein [Nocardia xishanensis]
MSVTYDHYPELHRLVEQLPPESAPEARAVFGDSPCRESPTRVKGFEILDVVPEKGWCS